MSILAWIVLGLIAEIERLRQVIFDEGVLYAERARLGNF